MNWLNRISVGFRIAGLLMEWFEDAARDRKIDAAEALDLVEVIALELGFKLEFDIPRSVANFGSILVKRG